MRWRTDALHHEAQAKGREEMFADYRLRVGEVTHDTQVPAGYEVAGQRFDETVAGAGAALNLVTAKRPAVWKETTNPADCSQYLGLDPYADGLLGWDVFEALETPGELVLLQSWRTGASAEAFELTAELPSDGRLRQVRIIRDYTMTDRREAPQYFPEAANSGP